ncbi:hypothetical protein PR048_007539 [Dryococelus australis]|uniref:Transposable element P transposase-like RNase H domain-containing protein n=1 Tax=Dryococelus australis TaxID=614101 RepID=A0ABQ9HW71_9NEOP|nr:hypothetical protein PR048_007539 [Dryococelus australis]
MRKRRRHPENSKCEENKNNGTHVVTQGLNEQTINKKRILWEDDDIVAAVTLRSISRKAYLHLRKNVGLSLSGLPTIRKWTRNLKFYLVSKKNYFQARGLASKWKLPIFNDFDKYIAKDKLFEVIKEVEDSNLKVVAIVSDMGGGNISLWKNLQISTNKVSVTNPVDVTRELWVFADIPHLIKLLRNVFLDYGGTEVSKCGSYSKYFTTRNFHQLLNLIAECILIPYLTSQLLMKYTENNTEEENAISDNVNNEISEVVDDIDDEPEEEHTLQTLQVVQMNKKHFVTYRGGWIESLRQGFLNRKAHADALLKREKRKGKQFCKQSQE